MQYDDEPLREVLATTHHYTVSCGRTATALSVSVRGEARANRLGTEPEIGQLTFHTSTNRQSVRTCVERERAEPAPKREILFRRG